MPETTPDAKAILSRLRNTRQAYARVQAVMQVRRALIARVITGNVGGNGTGTNVIAPFDSSAMVIRSMLGEPSKAVQHYAGRLSSNQPTITVTPITTHPDLTKRLDRVAGEQERLDAELWAEACAVGGGRGEHQRAAEAMVVGGAAYLLVMPRDLVFGLPDRIYHSDITDDEVAALRASGKLSPQQVPHPKTGQLVYAEAGDVWAARRKESLKAQKVSGRGLFMVRSFPRDMVLREKDAAGMKWWAATETVPQSTFGAGSDWARAAARRDSTFTGDADRYQLMLNDRGQVTGGITTGGPPGATTNSQAFTFITYVDREEIVYLVAGQNDVEGREVWRGKHGCTVQGQPECPAIEIPCIRGDIDTPDYEFLSPLDPLFAVIPNVNQFLTMRSNIAVYNATPRFVSENSTGSPLRGDDGEPVNVQSAPTPGLNPEEIAAYPGTVKQLTIDASDLDRAIELMFTRIDGYMPAPVTQGAAGASAPAWQVHQLIQQAQENLRQPADNLAYGIHQALLRMHGWLRTLDMDVYFWAAPGHRKDKRETRGLIEFDPKDITDSISVKIELDAPEDRIVIDQVWQAKLKDGLCTREQYFEMTGAQDARQSTIDSYAQMVADSLLLLPQQGQPQLGPVLEMVAKRVMGRLAVELPQWSPNAARATAQDMAMGARAQVAGQMQPPTGMTPPAPVQPAAAGTGNLSLANAAGAAVPGVGIAPTLAGATGGPPA